MEAKPHFSAPTQGVGAALGRGEEGAAHGGVPAERDPCGRQLGSPGRCLSVSIKQARAGRPASAPCGRQTPLRPRPCWTRRDAVRSADLGTHDLDAGTARDASTLHPGWRHREPSRVSRVPPSLRWLTPPWGDCH